MFKSPQDVVLIEVGPRDGLQNEPGDTSVQFRVDLIDQLSNCGFKFIEVGSFVSPKWVPQMANTNTVLQKISRSPNTTYVALVPNMKGMEMAISSGISEIAIFSAVSNTFSMRNTNTTISQGLDQYVPIVELAKSRGISVRGYVSCVMGCPYEGEVDSKTTINVVEKLFSMGCREVSLGDTIGVGTPSNVRKLLKSIKQHVPVNAIAVHFHDTYGQALANILVALDEEIAIIDSSIGGLGGCPYAKGASGNVATEDVVYMLDGLGVRTGLILDELVSVSRFVSNKLNKPLNSKVSTALISKQNT